MIAIHAEAQDLNLTNLKTPAIHHLTKIQPHGVLLVLDEPDLRVLQVSSNTRNTLGCTPEEALGKTLDEILDAYQVDCFRAGLSYNNLDLINPSKVWVRRQGDQYSVFDAVFHRTAD